MFKFPVIRKGLIFFNSVNLEATVYFLVWNTYLSVTVRNKKYYYKIQYPKC